jgi:hypothetical protein
LNLKERDKLSGTKPRKRALKEAKMQGIKVIHLSKSELTSKDACSNLKP